MRNFIGEDQIEVPLVQVLTKQLGDKTLNCFTAHGEDFQDGS